MSTQAVTLSHSVVDTGEENRTGECQEMERTQ